MSPRGAEAWLIDERWFKAYPLTTETSIGRASDSTIILRDPAVSRHHADVMKGPAGYVLYAFGSSGVKVNGMRVSDKVALQEGDVVEIAYTALRFTTKAPTSEMFVLPRDTPTWVDRLEITTTDAIRAMDRNAVLRHTRRYWHVILIVVLVLVLVVILAA
jgi:pSer/pThr/pTyr-binding forkhead associated (FHA) protein